MIIESNAGLCLVRFSDATGEYFYIGDDLGGVYCGAWSDETTAREIFEFVTGPDADPNYEPEGDIKIDDSGNRV